ncbi:hypothetical protein MTO96_012067 [Rhipicephalus appendiculatus]
MAHTPTGLYAVRARRVPAGPYACLQRPGFVFAQPQGVVPPLAVSRTLTVDPAEQSVLAPQHAPPDTPSLREAQPVGDCASLSLRGCAVKGQPFRSVRKFATSRVDYKEATALYRCTFSVLGVLGTLGLLSR